MIRRLPHLAMSLMFAGSLLLANTSCAIRHTDGAATLAPRFEPQEPGAQRLVQFSFGNQAAFGTCVEPACPAVTPKTLAIAGTVPMQAVAHRVASIATAARESAMQVELAAAPSPAASVPVRRVETAVHNVVVIFPFASAQLTESAQTALFASIRQARQADRIVISGRTDFVGNEKVNEALALARAESVRNYLHEQIPDLVAEISIDAKGRCCFVAPNETEDGRSRNRRVEVAFFSQGGG